MTIYLRHVKPFGFKGSSIWSDAKYSTHYYRVDPTTLTITVLSCLVPVTLAQYELTRQQFQSFQDGKLGLTPPGCCNATGKASISSYTILHTGELKDIKSLKMLMALHGILETSVKNN